VVAEVLRLIPDGIDRFGALIDAVPRDRWDAPTPCTDWSVRDLVNHVTSEHLWAPHLLRGETLSQVGARYDGDVLGDDPAGAWRSAAEPSREAWQRADSEANVHVSSGLIPLVEYGEQMHLDLVVHGWDLARGAGLEYDIDDRTAEHALGYVTPHVGEWRGSFADPVETDSQAPADRLIAIVGRDPRWTRPPIESR
jgi:uncharacterized protein (TIGR03086 family)